jgi:hypothetical protein
VNTGQVVTGSGDTLVTGDAVNVAARLEQAAGAGDVLVGGATYRLVRDAVEAELLPPLEAKGKSEPLTAYRLVAITGDVARVRRLDAPLVGRVRESRMLADACSSRSSERRASASPAWPKTSWTAPMRRSSPDGASRMARGSRTGRRSRS